MGVGGHVGVDPDAYAARAPSASAIRPASSSSSADSTLRCPTPARIAERQLLAVFPTPLKTICSGPKPAASARAISPGDDVRARTEVSQHPENREIAVGLYGEADPMRQ